MRPFRSGDRVRHKFSGATATVLGSEDSWEYLVEWDEGNHTWVRANAVELINAGSSVPSSS